MLVLSLEVQHKEWMVEELTTIHHLPLLLHLLLLLLMQIFPLIVARLLPPSLTLTVLTLIVKRFVPNLRSNRQLPLSWDSLSVSRVLQSEAPRCRGR